LIRLILAGQEGMATMEPSLPPKSRVVSSYAPLCADDAAHEADPYPRVASPAVPHTAASRTARIPAGDGATDVRRSRAPQTLPIRRRRRGRANAARRSLRPVDRTRLEARLQSRQHEIPRVFEVTKA